MKRKIVFYILTLVFLFVAVPFICDLASSGSNVYSEDYLLQLPSADELIRKIDSLKECDTTLNTYTINEKGKLVLMDKDGYNEYTRYLTADGITYCIDINKYQEFSTVIIQLTTVSFGDEHRRKFCMFNTDDLSQADNEKYKILFEENILARLNVDWKKWTWIDEIIRNWER